MTITVGFKYGVWQARACEPYGTSSFAATEPTPEKALAELADLFDDLCERHTKYAEQAAAIAAEARRMAKEYEQ